MGGVIDEEYEGVKLDPKEKESEPRPALSLSAIKVTILCFFSFYSLEYLLRAVFDDLEYFIRSYEQRQKIRTVMQLRKERTMGR